MPSLHPLRCIQDYFWYVYLRHSYYESYIRRRKALGLLEIGSTVFATALHLALLLYRLSTPKSINKMHFFKTLVALPMLQLAFAAPRNFTEPGNIPGTTSHYNEVRGKTYHYLLAEPSDEPKGTVLLLHGFPDFSITWHRQIPLLTDLGYRVIAPDLLGYAGTDSPCDIAHWTHKEMATDIVDLVGQIVPDEQVVLGGHDWGAAFVYKIALWYPDFASSLFTIAVPYMQPWLGPSIEWKDTAEFVADGTYPTLGYQLQWRDQSIDRNFTTRSEVSMFLNTLYGGLTPEGESGFSNLHGVNYDLMPLLGPQTLLSPETFEFYVDSMLENGLRGAFNWYRARRMDWEDELPLAEEGVGLHFQGPALYIHTLADSTFPESYHEDMGDFFDSLEIKGLDVGHWAHWESPEGVNELLEEWFASLE